jgi:hypothetical protein
MKSMRWEEFKDTCQFLEPLLVSPEVEDFREELTEAAE